MSLPPLQFKLAGLFVLALLTGCAAGPEAPEEIEPEPAAEEAPVPEPIREPVDPDVLYHVMAAESLGGHGDEAMDHYLEAARVSDDPEIAQQVARMSMGMEDWERAAEAARRWEELEPESTAASQIRASAYLRLGDSEGAGEVLQAMLEAAEDASRGWQTVAVVLGGAEDRELAESIMDTLIEDSGASEDSDALWGQSVLAWRMDDLKRAIELGEQAADIDPDPELIVWIAQLHVSADQLEEALEAYNRVRAMDTGDVEADLAAAEVLRELERLDEAIEIVEALPETTESLYTLGSLQVEAGEEGRARRTFETMAVLESPEDENLHAFYTAQLAEQAGLEQEAMAWFSRVDGGRFAVRARLRHAYLLGDRGELDQARTILADLRASQDESTMERAWLAESQILQDAGEYEEAMELLTDALTQLSDSDMLLYSRALVAVALDDIGLAEQDLRRILQLDSDHAMALNALGYTLTDRTSRHREAYRLISRALELEPDDPAILDSMGWVRFNLGDPEAAEPYLRKALEGDENPEIAAHLVEVLWHLDERGEARELLADFLDEHPDDRHLTDTRDRLGIDL